MAKEFSVDLEKELTDVLQDAVDYYLDGRDGTLNC